MRLWWTKQTTRRNMKKEGSVPKRFSGSSLIEVTIAAGVVMIGVGAVYLMTAQAQRLSGRNETNAIGLNILGTYIDNDSKAAYASFNPGIDRYDVPDLPKGEIFRLAIPKQIGGVGPNDGVKVLDYALTWEGTDGSHLLRATQEIIDNGLNNGT